MGINSPEVFYCVSSPVSNVNLCFVMAVRHIDHNDNVIVGYTSDQRENVKMLQLVMGYGWQELLHGKDIDRFDRIWEEYNVE